VIKKILSTAGVAASVVGVVAMGAPQAMAVSQSDARPLSDGPMGDTALGETLDQVPVLKGNDVER
jgi:hypothetical protein